MAPYAWRSPFLTCITCQFIHFPDYLNHAYSNDDDYVPPLLTPVSGLYGACVVKGAIFPGPGRRQLAADAKRVVNGVRLEKGK